MSILENDTPLVHVTTNDTDIRKPGYDVVELGSYWAVKESCHDYALDT